MKMPKFLGKEGRERRSQRGKAVATTKLLKWDHIGTVQKPLLKVMPVGEAVREPRDGVLGSCAVVGNGGGLKLKQQGGEIDAHNVVIRFNGGPVVGFEKYVGRRTTWRLTNYDHFAFHEEDADRVERGVLQHVTNGMALQKLVEYEKDLIENPEQSKHEPKIFMLDPEFHYHAFNAFGLGAPSNGFYGTLLAGELCQRITMYGFQKEWRGQKLPYHYYNEIEPNESQSARDTAEAARFQQWLDTMNSYARTCAANSDCVDPRIDKNYEGDRFQYGEQKI